MKKKSALSLQPRRRRRRRRPQFSPPHVLERAHRFMARATTAARASTPLAFLNKRARTCERTSE